ncbi:MAG: cysteine desulfurase [Treponemataceae bacterium]|nr:cysteine desulfurase [Treponemataceae bacterium]
MENNEIYCDWAATALFDKEIMENALNKQLECNGNPSSVHAFGQKAKKILEESRKKAAKAFGVNEKSIFFTSGGTESNHLVITNLLLRPNKGSIVISNIEHPAIREMAENMKKCGWKVINCKCDSNGIVSAESVVKSIEDDTALVCVMAVNNEVGSIQPIYEIADALIEKCKGRKKPKFHVDCVQAAGKIPLDLSHKGIDSASFSAHKIGGSRGIGILYIAENAQESFLKGGGQEGGIRSGTENLFGIVTMAESLEKYFFKSEKDAFYQRYEQQKIYSEKFIEELKTIPGFSLIPESRQNNDERFSPWVIQGAIDKIPGEVMVRALSEKGIYISTGSACSSRKMKRPILQAMGVKADLLEEGVRFSFGFATTESQMQTVAKTVKEIASRF